MSTGKKLASIRKSRNLSQAALAASTGVTRDVIASIETDRRNITLLEAALFATVLEVDIKDLVDQDEIRARISKESENRIKAAQEEVERANAELRAAKEMLSRLKGERA